MTGLQTAYYIVGLVFMGVMFVVLSSILVALLKIKSTVNKVHDNIQARIDKVKNVSDKTVSLVDALKYIFR